MKEEKKETRNKIKMLASAPKVLKQRLFHHHVDKVFFNKEKDHTAEKGRSKNDNGVKKTWAMIKSDERSAIDVESNIKKHNQTA